MTPRLYKAFLIKQEDRANLLLLFVILSSFHTLLLSQSCNLFFANFPFQVFDKIRHCKYLIYKFSNFNRKYSVISILSLLSLLVSGPRVLKIDLLFVKVVYLSTCIEPVWWCITLVSHKSVGQPCQVVPVVVP